MTTGVIHFVRGMIIQWSGAIADIPAGFALCNGDNGTPDLRDKFIVGSGSTYSPDDTGGNVNHAHDGTTDGHSHTLNSGAVVQGGATWHPNTDSKTDTFTTDNADGRPPYYSLAFIMRL